MLKVKSIAMVAAVAIAAVAPAQSAHACSKGFLAQLGCAAGILTPEQAQQLDGSPLGRAAGQAWDQFKNPVGRPATLAPAPVPSLAIGTYTPYGGPVFGQPVFAPPVLQMPPVVQWRPAQYPGYGMPPRHYRPRLHHRGW